MGAASTGMRVRIFPPRFCLHIGLDGELLGARHPLDIVDPILFGGCGPVVINSVTYTQRVPMVAYRYPWHPAGARPGL